MFGRKIEDDRLAYFGARMILQDGRLDVVHDRMTWDGKVSDKFKKFINGVLRPNLENFARVAPPSGEEVLIVNKGKFYAEASPQGSHGYMYVGAIERPDNYLEFVKEDRSE